MPREVRLRSVDDMALTAPNPILHKRSAHAREMPRWCAGILAIAGNIVILGIIATAGVLMLAAAALVFGTAFLANL